MTAFVDATLLRFAQDAFVTDMLTNGVGLTALFNAAFQATEVQPQGFTMGQLSARAYKVPIYDSVRSNGTDERIVPDSQRVQISRVWSRLGRLDWIDVAFDAVLNTHVQTLVGPLQGISIETLEQKLGGVRSIDDLRAKYTRRASSMQSSPSSISRRWLILRRGTISSLSSSARLRQLSILTILPLNAASTCRCG